MDKRQPQGGSEPESLVELGNTEAPDAWIGRTLEGRYRIDGKVGEGGMGAVYRAEHLKLGRAVAVKLLLPQYVEQSGLRQRFEREAKVLAAVSNAHIVGLLDYGVEGSCPYLVMELLEGETLRDRMARGPMPIGEALALMRQLLEGLAYAHAQGMIHRDLKPANVFLQRVPHHAEVVRILDFGLAKFATGDARRDGPALTGHGAVSGTPGYMAPEQAAGGACDASADVYAMGVLLFELLTGRRPFVGEPHEIARMRLLDVAPTLASVAPTLRPSPALEALVARALAKDRKDRFASGAELLAALLALPEAADLAGRSSGPGSSAGDAATQVATPRRSPSPAEVASTVFRAGGSRGVSLVPRKSSGFFPKLLVFTLLVGASAAVAYGVYAKFFAPAATDENLGTLTMDDGAQRPSPTLPAGAPGRAAGQAPVPTPTTPTTEAQPAPTPEPLPVEPAITPTLDEVAPSEAPPAEVPPIAPPVASEIAPTLATAPPPQVPTTQRAAPRDPWSAGVPRALASTKALVDRGRPLTTRSPSASTERVLRAWNAANRDDSRAALLIARIYFLRGWRPDAVEWYRKALERDPGCAGAQHLAADLVALATHAEQGPAARELLVQYLGPQAMPALVSRLGDPSASASDRATLERLQAMLLR